MTITELLGRNQQNCQLHVNFIGVMMQCIPSSFQCCIIFPCF